MLRGEREGSALWLPWILTAVVGIAAALLVVLGNPGNMGICGACFLRDTAGALGFFSGAGPKIFRPEVLGVILGAMFWMVGTRRWHARSGSYAATRFFFGVWMALGSLVFLGCPFRMLQRIGGGDLNAVVGAIGLIAGVGIGLWLEKRGYQVGKTAPVPAPIGMLGPGAFLLLLVLFLLGGVLLGPSASEEGPPAHAFWLVSLVIAILAGGILSATGFCAVTAARQVFLPRKTMVVALLFLVVSYGVTVFAFGKGNLGFEGQPAAHSEWLWNILAMVLVGLTGVLVGGCPVRQIVMTGEGNGDALMTVMGLLVGGALAHTLGIASTGAGVTEAGRWAVAIGLVLSLAYGFAISFKRTA